MLRVKTPMLHEMLQFEMPITPYKIVLGYNVTQLKGNTIPLTASIFLIFQTLKSGNFISFCIF